MMNAQILAQLAYPTKNTAWRSLVDVLAVLPLNIDYTRMWKRSLEIGHRKPATVIEYPRWLRTVQVLVGVELGVRVNLIYHSV